MRLFWTWAPIAAMLVGCLGSAAKPAAGPLKLTLADSVVHLDALVREPMVVRHPSGTLFVSGYWDSIPPLYRSVDGGTWTRVDIGTVAAGAAGNSDIDLAVAPDGTLYLITLQFDRAAYSGKSIHMAISSDVGVTWSWTKLSETGGDDRPWVDVAPDGTVHAIWNDGSGVSHAYSTDRGATWTETDRANSLGGSSHLAIGPAGEVAVRFVPMSASGNRFDEGVDGLSLSVDRGATWRRQPPPAPLGWFPLFDRTVTPPKATMPAQPRWVEPLAWDSTGALYSFWAADSALVLGRSLDRGTTWTAWRVATSAEVPYYPYLVARGSGELAASWVSGKGDQLRANVAAIRVPTNGAPTVAVAEPFLFESFMLPGFGDPTVRDAAGEYLPVVFLPDGSIGIVTPVQNPGAGRVGFSWRRYSTAR